MTTEIQVFPAFESIADYKAGLKGWKPKTDEEAGKYLAMVSLISGTAGDAAKTAAKERLARKCDDCDTLEFDGFTLKAIRKTGKTFNTSEKLEKLTQKRVELAAKLKNLDADIKAEEMKAGFTESEPVFSHWLVQ